MWIRQKNRINKYWECTQMDLQTIKKIEIDKIKAKIKMTRNHNSEKESNVKIVEHFTLSHLLPEDSWGFLRNPLPFLPISAFSKKSRNIP